MWVYNSLQSSTHIYYFRKRFTSRTNIVDRKLNTLPYLYKIGNLEISKPILECFWRLKSIKTYRKWAMNSISGLQTPRKRSRTENCHILAEISDFVKVCTLPSPLQALVQLAQSKPLTKLLFKNNSDQNESLTKMLQIESWTAIDDFYGVHGVTVEEGEGGVNVISEKL